MRADIDSLMLFGVSTHVIFILLWCSVSDRLLNPFGARGGLMVSALGSGSDGPGSSPVRGSALCSWARHFTLVVPLSTQVYKWVPAN